MQNNNQSPEIIFSKNPVPYMQSYEFMEKRAEEIYAGKAPETIWFLEHFPVYTAGASANEKDLLSRFNDIPVIKTNRGGKHTLHSPGQSVVYLMLDLKKRVHNKIPDPRKYVETLEEIIIQSLKKFGIKGEKRKDRIGVWVINPKTTRDEKIAAIGVKFKKGVTLHGFALNVNNDLNLFNGIIPCGISEFGVCSLKSLGCNVDLQTVNNMILEEILKSFYPHSSIKKNDKNPNERTGNVDLKQNK